MSKALSSRLSAAPSIMADWLEDCRAHAGWLVFLLVLVLVGFELAVKLPAILGVAATGSGEKAVFADYFATVVLAVMLGVAILAAPFEESDKAKLFFLWVVKATITLLVLPVYEAHYVGAGANATLIGLDARMYFVRGALDAASTLPALGFGSGTSIMIWIVRAVTQALPAYFHLLEMLWSFVGLLAIYLFYRGWRWLVPALDSRFLLWIGLFPSILFWSSILGKDPITLFGVGLYFYAVAKWTRTHRMTLVGLAALGVLIAAAIRPWYAVILAAPLVAFPLTSRRLPGWQKGLLLAGIGVGVFFAARLFLAVFQIESAQELVQTSNVISHGWQHGGSSTDIAQFTTGLGMLAFLPIGVFTALFRPLPGDVGSAFGLLASAVSVVLLVAFARTVWRTPLRTLKRSWFLWLALLVLVWAVMYAFPSSQNLGTAVRFRLGILPVLWPALLLCAIHIKRYGLIPLMNPTRKSA